MENRMYPTYHAKIKATASKIFPDGFLKKFIIEIIEYTVHQKRFIYRKSRDCRFQKVPSVKS